LFATVIVQGETGVADFDSLQADLASGRSERMVYFAFDLLDLDGFDLQNAPLIERKRALAALLDEAKSACFHLAPHLEVAPALVFEQASAGLEGIVCKLDAPYRSGARASWLKIQVLQTRAVPGYQLHPCPRHDRGAALGASGGEGARLCRQAGTGFTQESSRAPPRPRRTRHRLANGPRRLPETEVDLGAAGTLGDDRLHRDQARRSLAPHLAQMAWFVAKESEHERYRQQNSSDCNRVARCRRRRGDRHALGRGGAHEHCGDRRGCAPDLAGHPGGMRGTPCLQPRGLPERSQLRAGLRGAARLQRRSLPKRSQLRVSVA
jgi:hypothetical protein